MTHQTWASLSATLEAGRTPCGDDEEDGSGRGICQAADGSAACYEYIRTAGGYHVTGYEKLEQDNWFWGFTLGSSDIVEHATSGFPTEEAARAALVAAGYADNSNTVVGRVDNVCSVCGCLHSNNRSLGRPCSDCV